MTKKKTSSKKDRSSLLTPKLEAYFKDYSNHHKTKGNKVTHYFGITFIAIGLLGLLGGLVVLDGMTGSDYFRVDGGTILLALGILWYLFIDWKIALPFSLVLVGLYFLGRALSSPVDWTLFIAGWILQGIGHGVYEKKSPAFFKNFTHLLVGPLWIFARVIGYK